MPQRTIEDGRIVYTKKGIMEVVGIGRDLFEAIEPELPYIQPKKRKLYHIEDVKRELARMKRLPICIDNPKSFSQRNQKATTRTLLSTECGLDEAVKQTTKERQTSTH